MCLPEVTLETHNKNRLFGMGTAGLPVPRSTENFAENTPFGTHRGPLLCVKAEIRKLWLKS